jgi:hypothetical protein
LTQLISVHDRRTPFSLTSAARPNAVVLDPAADLFRRLFPEEIPASINSIKGAESLTVIVSRSAGRGGVPTAQMLVRAMGLDRARIVEEARFQPSTHGRESRLYVGFPEDPTVLPSSQGAVALFPGRFSVAGREFAAQTDTFFGVFSDPHSPEAVVGILYPVHPRFGPVVARKAAHYGKYSYLVFAQGQNAAKGVWPVSASPLIVKWE